MCGMEFKSNAGLEAHIPQATYQALIDSSEILLTDFGFRLTSNRRTSNALDVVINSPGLQD
jgi:hypothetical protein